MNKPRIMEEKRSLDSTSLHFPGKQNPHTIHSLPRLFPRTFLLQICIE